MPLQDFRTRSFQLPNLLDAVSLFEMKTNPYHTAAETQMFNVYTELKRQKFLSHDYGTLCSWAYPETQTQAQLETCIAFNLWLFAYDDMADESGLKQSAEGLRLAVDISVQVLKDPDGPVPTFRFARMLQEWSRGKCSFVDAFLLYTEASLSQTSHRINGNTSTVEEFIQIRRNSSGLKLVFAFIEYAMGLDIPDEIHNDSSMIAVVQAAADIVAWNNDLCSFNNEQSHGDSQNIVYCAFVEKNSTLQAAIDFVANMVRTRINDFLLLKKVVPSFGIPDVEKYLQGLEYWISGSMHWYYHSKHPLPFFPPELEREIFESAAELYPETIPTLLLVSQRVHEWIERIKYITVTPSGSGASCPLNALQHAVRSDSKPASFFHDRVRNLFVQPSKLKEDELREILSACSGVRFLALMLPSAGPSILPSLGAMKPRRLCFYLTDFFTSVDSTALSHSMFTSVTHLDIFDHMGDSAFQQWSWSDFGLLPALTHLSLFKFPSSAVGTELLSKCKTLEVLIRMDSTGNPYDNPLSIEDVRFVCMVMEDDAYVGDWIIGTKGGMDFWARADAFVAKRRRGEIKPDSRCWIEDGDGI
ncbi:isoprenoid synthase domain-containing protein [Mycena epipterygia]|nr:isoprenoid synthase domain-containing protein [Mycena epipterygia]